MTRAVTQQLGTQEQLQRLRGRYDRLIRAAEQTADTVMKDVTELRKQQEQEFHLQIAHEVQRRFNATVASLPGFEFAGSVCSATLTGGDYFEFIAQPDGCLCIAIGDVSGHGFGAALVMAETRAYVRSYAASEWFMGAILTRVNNALVADLDGSRFSSSRAIPLDYGETLVLLTDGVTEAAKEDGAQFGADRALGFITCHLENKAADLVRGIHETVLAFSGGGPPSDDITPVICKVIP